MVIKKSIKPNVDKLSPYYQLYILLNTVRGTVPLQRDIGLDPRMLDKPITVIAAGIQAELQYQINTYIKGLKLLSVNCKADNTGKLDIECEVELNE
nr:MAG TPA: Regulator of RpoS, Anti-adapter protein regulator, ClpXP adaptor, anti-adaptor.0A [Caudoviricetes sp.]